MKKSKKPNVLFLTQLAILVAIELLMKVIGLGSVPVGPLYMSFLTVPIAVGAIVLGPAAGAVLGGVFGFVSFMDAVKGASIMTSSLLAVSPLNTFILCFGMRVLMGWCVGLLNRGVRRVCSKPIVPCFVTSLAAPVLNTIFFMGYIVLAFYQTQYIQGLVAAQGTTNPLAFVVVLVGIQGVIEAIVCSIAGTAIGSSVLKVTGKTAGAR